MTTLRARTMAALIGALILIVLGAACTTTPDEPAERRGPAPTLEARDIAPAESPLGRAAQRIAAVEGTAAGWEILDVTADGAVLYGRRLPAGPGYHGRPTFAVKLLAAHPSAAPERVGDGPVVDAALSPARDHPVALVTATGTLALWRPNTEPIAIDDAVAHGLSFAADGTSLVYAKGVAPELEIYLADLSALGTGPPTAAPRPNAQQLTENAAADYLPALSQDGSRVLWVSSRTGIPSLWAMTSAGRGSQQLTNAGLRPGPGGDARRALSSPDGRSPPLWGKGFVVYFDGQGVSVVSEASGELIGQLAGARQPHWLTYGEEFAFELEAGTFKAVRLPAPGMTP